MRLVAMARSAAVAAGVVAAAVGGAGASAVAGAAPVAASGPVVTPSTLPPGLRLTDLRVVIQERPAHGIAAAQWTRCGDGSGQLQVGSRVWSVPVPPLAVLADVNRLLQWRLLDWPQGLAAVQQLVALPDGRLVPQVRRHNDTTQWRICVGLADRETCVEFRDGDGPLALTQWARQSISEARTAAGPDAAPRPGR